MVVMSLAGMERSVCGGVESAQNFTVCRVVEAMQIFGEHEDASRI
jgi:hypothetical protein